MKARWHIGVIIILFTFFGVVFQQPASTPNQEILLQFSEDVTSIETQNTIAVVKKQLLALGAENIQIKNEEGNLKITYYSNADVSIVKDILSKEKELVLDPPGHNNDQDLPALPSPSKSITFNLDVYEIQNSNDFESGFEGVLITELKSESDRLFNQNVQFYFFKTNVEDSSRIIKTAYKLSRDIALAIDNTSRIIPEVRAGPIA